MNVIKIACAANVKVWQCQIIKKVYFKLMTNNLIKVHKIKSRSEPGAIHEVSVYENGLIECTCTGYFYREDCAHIKFIRAKHYAPKPKIDLPANNEFDKFRPQTPAAQRMKDAFIKQVKNK